MVKTQMVKERFSCRAITKTYGEHVVLKDISLQIGVGETVALMGRSGCGKSTLLKCLNFIETPTSGSAYLDGQQYMHDGSSLYSLSEVRLQVGIVFQEFNLFPNLTARRNITLALEDAKRMTRGQSNLAADEMAEKLGITSVLNRYPETLSGGQAQRVALARALILQPKVLLLDEITAALDPEATKNVIDAVESIRSLDGGSGLSILVVTHLLQFAKRSAHRILYLSEGKITEDWPAKEFSLRCETEDARAFISLSRAWV